MDFLEIRKKARERATARAAAAAPAPSPEAGPLPAAGGGEAPPEPDQRFTTWRPGQGAPPPLALEPEAPLSQPSRGTDDDFTVVTALSGALQQAGPARPRRPAPAPPPGDPLGEFFYREDEEAPELPAIGGAADRAAPGEPLAALDEFLTFRLGAEEYAVAIAGVREVLKAPPITEVPRAPAHILGVVTVRGEVVAVCDPRRRLGLGGEPPRAGAARIVVADAGEGPCGLLVDGVTSVVRLRRGTLEPCPQGIGGVHAECLAGIGREGERLFTVLDLAALLRRVSAPGARGEGSRRGA